MNRENHSLQLTGKRILVLEDEFILGEDLRMQLEGLGYEVVAVVDSVEEALRIAEEARPDLALLDIQIGRDKAAGIRLANLFRTHYQLPFIFLSSHTSSKVIQAAKTAHAHGYLIKPTHKEALMAAIEVALHKSAYEDISRQEREKNALLSLSDAITTVRNYSSLFQFIDQQLKPALGFVEGLAFVADADSQNFGIYQLGKEIDPATLQAKKTLSWRKQLPATDALIRFFIDGRHNLQTKAISLLEEIKTDSSILAVAHANQATHLHSLPFRTEQVYAGFLILFYQNAQSANAQEYSFLAGVANQLSSAMFNIRSYLDLHERNKREQLKLQIIDGFNQMTGWPTLFRHSMSLLQEYIPFAAVACWFSVPYASYSLLLEQIGSSEYRSLSCSDVASMLRVSKEEVLKWTATLHQHPENGLPSSSDRPLHQHLVRIFGFTSYWSVSHQIGEDSSCTLIFYTKHEQGFTATQHAVLHDALNAFMLSVEKFLAYRKIKELSTRLEQEKSYLKEEITTDYNFKEIIGSSSAMQAVLWQVKQVAASDTTVMIQGETGTGKELIARALHDRSPRSEQPFIKLNCAALPPQLIESELFGHERGSFTGALQQRIGKFELANNGTILLDEIGEMPINLQAKLLRVLQEREFERIGGNTIVRLNVRIIAATNRDLLAEIEAGRFRADLYYRLNVFPIQLPPLRDRGDDMISLAMHFLHKKVRKIGKRIQGISEGGLRELRDYHWPGNVRELEHVIERSLLLSEGGQLDIILDRHNQFASRAQAPVFQLKTFQEAEKEVILQTLQYSNGRIRGAGGAAEILDMHPSTLDSKMKKLGIRKQFLVGQMYSSPGRNLRL